MRHVAHHRIFGKLRRHLLVRRLHQLLQQPVPVSVCVCVCILHQLLLQPVPVSVCLCVCMSLSLCISIYLSIYQSINQSIYIYMHTCNIHILSAHLPHIKHIQQQRTTRLSTCRGGKGTFICVCVYDYRQRTHTHICIIHIHTINIHNTRKHL